MRYFLLILLISPLFSLYSQSIVHYVGPVHSNQKNTLFAKEQYIYVTSPYKGGNVYVRISSFGSSLFPQVKFPNIPLTSQSSQSHYVDLTTL